jgi:signal transduction histidine kinase
MTPLSEWLKPPRSLLFSLFLVTLVSVSTVAWFGWQLLNQERAVEAQRAQVDVDQAADRIVANLKSSLAVTGEELGSWAMAPPSDGKPKDGVLLLLDGSSVAILPAGRTLYIPAPARDPEAGDAAFADGEALEFQQAQPERAIDWYRRLADSKTSELRAGALLRVARVYRKLGRNAEARDAYRELAAMSSVSVAGVPAELAGREALTDLAAEGRQQSSAALLADLKHGRWPLTRGQFEFYWGEAARFAGSADSPPAEGLRWSYAAGFAWNELKRDLSERGQMTLWTGGRPLFLIWRSFGSRRAALVTQPDLVLQPLLAGAGVALKAVDSQNHVVAGRDTNSGRAAVRPAAETQLPWTLYFTSAPYSQEAGRSARQFLLLVTAVMVLFLIAGAYFIARAIRRDMETARMQSDFVSAVSHEFRSPLTSIRQLSELLAFDRVPSPDRRQVYYEALVKESTRLQRLVEALLNFGRMEAGARQYHFEELDPANLVERVAAEFEANVAAAGRRIELDGEHHRWHIDADPEALSVALRNLVDNALKYSPNCPTVWVEWGEERERVAIRVRDEGLGIPAAERRAIFRKFVRGSAAASANVKGSGVGLAMVRHIVAAHGGEITVASEPGQGSTFTILLPVGARI